MDCNRYLMFIIIFNAAFRFPVASVSGMPLILLKAESIKFIIDLRNGKNNEKRIHSVFVRTFEITKTLILMLIKHEDIHFPSRSKRVIHELCIRIELKLHISHGKRKTGEHHLVILLICSIQIALPYNFPYNARNLLIIPHEAPPRNI